MRAVSSGYWLHVWMIDRVGIAGGIDYRHRPTLVNVIAVLPIDQSGQADVHRMNWYETASGKVTGGIELL